MELLIGAAALTAVCTALAALEEHVRWLDSYKEAGEEDRQYQRDRTNTPPYTADYRE